VRPFHYRAARCLLIFASSGIGTALAAQPPGSAEPAASARAPAKRSLPVKKLDAPLHWDRLDPSTVERASKGSVEKAPSFPAERR
jgi:hypothetical protein